MPLGPVSIYAQAFFDLIFGNNLMSMIIHGFLLGLIPSLLFYFVARKKLGVFKSFLFSFFFYLSFNGMVFYPFYKQIAYFFFFLNIFLLFEYYDKESMPSFVYLLSAVLGTFAFYSKQDIGALLFFFVLLYFLFCYRNQLKRTILLYFIPSVLFMIISYIFLSNIPGFTYWFNIGQPPHNARAAMLLHPRTLWGIATSWTFYLALFFSFFVLFRKKIKSPYSQWLNKNQSSINLLCLFIIVAAVSLIALGTSGVDNNAFSVGIPVLVLILYILIKENTSLLLNQSKLVVTYFLIALLLLTVSPFAVYGQIIQNYKNPELVRIPNGCYAGSLMPKTPLESLSTIREIIEKNNRSFVSLTEYSFLYCDYDVEPPKKLPLWIYTGTSIFDENVPDLIQTIKELSPKVILLQDPHRNPDKNFTNNLKKDFISLGYTEAAIVDAAASYGQSYYDLGFTKTDVVKIAKTDAPIYILVKNSSYKNQSNSNQQVY